MPRKQDEKPVWISQRKALERIETTQPQRKALRSIRAKFRDHPEVQGESVRIRVKPVDDATSDGLWLMVMFEYTLEHCHRWYDAQGMGATKYRDNILSGVGRYVIGHDGSVAELHGPDLDGV